MKIVAFLLDGIRQAIPLDAVERVLPAAWPSPVPGSPKGLLGLFDLAGQVVPVFQLRERLCMDPCPLQPSDRFILVRTSQRLLAIVADAVEGVLECESPQPLAQHAVGSLRGVTRIDDAPGGTLLLIHDLERFLSPVEEQQLESCMERAR